MTDKLKELAMAATHGQWHLSGPFAVDKATHEPWFRVFAENTLYLEVRADCDGYVKGKNAANAAYITAASPDVVLALIAENERLKSTIFTDNTQTVVNCEKEIEKLNGYIQKANMDVTEACAERDAALAEVGRLKNELDLRESRC